MKAIVQDRYGPVEHLELREIDVPEVRHDEVLVRVRAASVHPDVWHVINGRPYALRLMGAGLRRPRVAVPGTDVSGRVESVGAAVTRFRPGDRVFGETIRGHQWKNGAGYAEYVAVPERSLEPIPPGIGFVAAAAVPTSGLIAHDCVVDQGQVRERQLVLVNGAGGGGGSFAVQLAKAHGAEVIGVDATDKLDVVESAGADRMVDYRYEDFAAGSERYDLIIDIPGGHSLMTVRRNLVPEGTYVLVGHDNFGQTGGRWIGLGISRFLRFLVLAPLAHRRINPRRRSHTKDPLATLAEHMRAGAIRPIVDRTFPLRETASAIRHLAEGRARGKVVITVPD